MKVLIVTMSFLTRLNGLLTVTINTDDLNIIRVFESDDDDTKQALMQNVFLRAIAHTVTEVADNPDDCDVELSVAIMDDSGASYDTGWMRPHVGDLN